MIEESVITDLLHKYDASTDPLNNIRVFEKRGGTTNHGTNYEIYVTALVALRLALDDDVEELQIASNHPDFGAFDDIIVQVKRFGNQRKTYAVQLKHKTKQKPIGGSFFTSDDFCILKYKETFLDVKSKLEPDDLENTTFCLFTNLDVEQKSLERIPFKLKKHLEKKENKIILSESLHISMRKHLELNSKDFLYTKGNICELKIQAKDDSEKQSFDQYQEFFRKFNFYGGQLTSEEVKLQITDEFTKRFGIQAQEVGEKFISFIDDWFFRKSEIIWLSKRHIKLKILELLLTPFLIEPVMTGVSLKHPNLWNLIVSFGNVTVVEENVEDKNCLSKIYEAIEYKINKILNVLVNFTNWLEFIPKDQEATMKEKRLGSILNTVNEYGRINTKRLLIASWKMGLVPLVLKVNESNKNYITAILNANSDFNGQYIFIGNSLGKLTLNRNLKIVANMSVNTSISTILKTCKVMKKLVEKYPKNVIVWNYIANRLLKKIKTLDRNAATNGFYTNLRNVNQTLKILQILQRLLKCSLCNQKHITDRNQLKKVVKILFNSQNILENVKKRSWKFFDFNISDKLAQTLLVEISKFTKLNLQGRRQLRLFDIVENNMKGLNSILRNVTPSLLLRVIETKDTLNATYTVGMKLQKNSDDYITRNFKWRKFIVNEKDLLRKFEKNLNLISGDPGMGKTTTLKSLAFHCNPRYWVLLMNLNKIQEDFFDPSKSKLLEDPVKYLFEKLEKDATSFTIALFNYLRKNRKILIILDSFDEVSPKYNEVVIQLIKKAQEEELRVWIATRPFARSYIEKEFNPYTIFMLGFEEQDFKNYLSKHNVSQSDKNFILSHIDKNFYCIPLHAYMLTTVKNFTDQYEITDVYEKFIAHKFETFCKKHDLAQCKNNIDVLLKPSKKKLIKNHEVMALAVVYGLEFFKVAIAMNHEKFAEDFQHAIEITENCKNPLGLVTGISNGVPIFIHKSYAEYMTAKWLTKNIIKASVDYAPDMFAKLNPNFVKVNENFRNVKLYEKIFQTSHKVVRLMFDKIAAEGRPLHLAVLNSNLDKVKALCEKMENNDFDKFGRTPLHLAISVFDPQTDFLDKNSEVTKFKCKILSTLVDYLQNRSEIDIFTKDAFGWDCFTYAKLTDVEGISHMVTYHGELKALTLFLNNLSDDELMHIINKKTFNSMMTLLSTASVNGHAEIVEYLVTKGADTEERDSSGNTPLQIASKGGHLEVVKYLIDVGVDKNTCNHFGNTSLHSAANFGHLEVVKHLVNVGLDVQVANNSKQTSLHVAAENGHLHVVEYLVDQGANIVAEDANASTPSHSAAERGHFNVVTYLTEKEAKIYEGFLNEDSVEVNEDVPDISCDYISTIATLYALKLCLREDIEDVHVGLNFKKYGKFGNVILRIKFAQNETTKVFAIGFMEGNFADLYIQATNDSYNLLKLALQDSSDDLVGNVEFNDLSLYLHVNCELEKDEQGNCKYLPSDVEDFMARKYYKLSASSELASKIHVCYDSFDCEKEEKVLKSILEVEFRRSDENVVCKLIRFVKSKEGSFVTKYDMKSKLLEYFLFTFIEEPKIYVSVGVNEHVWKGLVNTSDVTLINNCTTEVIQKIFYSMQEQVKEICNINLNLKLWLRYKKYHPVMRYLPCMKNLMVILWKRHVLPLFIKITAEEVDFLSNVLNKLFLVNYKFIIMSDGIHNLKLRKDLIIFDSLEIATDEVKTSILENILVSLQGRSPSNLLRLTDKLNMSLISSTFIIRTYKKNAIYERFKPIRDFCMSRRFFKPLLRVEVLWKTEGNIFILDRELASDTNGKCRECGLNVINLEEISDEVADLILNTEDLNVILIVGQNKTNLLYNKLLKNEKLSFLKIHCLKVAGVYLEWLKSSNVVRDLNDFLVEEETVGEDELLDYFKNSLNVISGVAGMGKSFALQSLIWTCSSEKFVLFFNLAELVDDFKQKYAELLSEPLTYLYQKLYGQTPTALEEELFKFYREQKKVVIFMDEFDKLLMSVADSVMNVVEKLLHDGICIWIATRPLGAICLQGKFNIIPINIQELDNDEKQNYLDEILHLPGEQQKSLLYTKTKSSFYRIPLHLKTLAELLNNQQVTVNQIENGIEWYQGFVQNKIHKIYKSHGWDDTYNFQIFEKHCTHAFQILALISIYGTNFILDNNISHAEYLEETMNNVLKCGKNAEFIGTVKNNIPVFTDDVYRDYFLATWLMQNIDHFLCQAMYKILFESNFHSARLMFDKFVANPYALHLAVLNNDVEEVERLCKSTNKIHNDHLGRTPLHLAASHFKHFGVKSPEHDDSCRILSHIVELMERYENDYNIQDKLLKWDWLQYAKESGNLELFEIAAYRGYVNIMKFYLKSVNGYININKPSRDGFTSLELAVEKSHKDVVTFLLQNGVTKSAIESNFLLAAAKGKMTALKIFAKEDIDINCTDTNGWNAVHKAVYYNRKNCFKFLLLGGSGIDFKAKTKNGCTALHLAAARGNSEIVNILIRKRINVNEVNLERQTPLHLAIINDHLNCTKSLVIANADVTIANNKGVTPLDAALSKGHNGILALFLEQKKHDFLVENQFMDTFLKMKKPEELSDVESPEEAMDALNLLSE